MTPKQFYKLPDKLRPDMEQFFKDIEDYQNDVIPEVKFKGIRVAHGVYEQRKPQTHMIRIRCAAGGITPVQLERVGQLGYQCGSGEVHVTTRQDVQLHYVQLGYIEYVINELVKVGLSPRGGGGNTVRNIMADYDSGVSPDSVFDVEPYAKSLTSRMLDEPDSWNLPRKFKIAFSCSARDHIRAGITCLGFFAKIENGEKGFSVYCAGGMGSAPKIGHKLFDFVPHNHVYHITKAIKIMFDKYGNRRNRNRAKLKFLFDKLGEEQFLAYFREEYDRLIQIPNLDLILEDSQNVNQADSSLTPAVISEELQEKYHFWEQQNVFEQIQEGLSQVWVPLKLGDLTSEDAIRFAQALKPYGENIIRLSIDQNIWLRNIPTQLLPNIFHIIRSVETLSFTPSIIGQMVACTGADTCKLGICLPRGVTPKIQDKILESDLDPRLIRDVKIHISGCPNTCGGHHSGDLGFFGRVIKIEKQMVPGYNVLAGAIMEEGKSAFATKVGQVIAKDMPHFVCDILKDYQIQKQKNGYQVFSDYIQHGGLDFIKELCSKYERKTLEDRFLFDWGSVEKFSLLKGQKAECSAGMFDMIDVDADAMVKLRREYEESEDLGIKKNCIDEIMLASCRMLLVTRGVEATGKDIFKMFQQHFIRSGIVPERFNDLITLEIEERKNDIYDARDQVLELSDYMKELYRSMDDSLRFKNIEQTESLKEASALTYGQGETSGEDSKEQSSQEFFKDLRGVGCPINFVKVKIQLSKMNSGDRLVVLLDDGSPIENVPGSVKEQGDLVLSQEQQNDQHWMVTIQKA